MEKDKAAQLLIDAAKGFHGRFKKMYGQIALRLDENTYMITGGNVPLSDIRDDFGFEICDINTGDLGEIFRSRPGVNAFMFGISPDSVLVSSEYADRGGVLVPLEDAAQICGPVIKIIPDATAANVLAAIPDAGACMVSGTGIIALSADLNRAAAWVQIIEKSCEAYVHGKVLGGVTPLDSAVSGSLHTSYLSEYLGTNEERHVNYIGFDESEFSLRSELTEIGRNIIRRDLAYGAWGNASVRLSDHEMLITPTSMDYFDINIEDIVRVDINTLDYGDQRVPSSEANVHARLYRDYPDCGAVILTHSNAMSTFAACEAGFVISDPAMQQLIGHVKVVDYAMPGSQELEAAVSQTLSDTHAAVISHHGAIFRGPSADVVFAVAEAVEMRARNLLDFDTRDLIEEASETAESDEIAGDADN